MPNQWEITFWHNYLRNNQMSFDELENFPYSFSIIMNKVQVLVYGVLESVRDLRSTFVGHSLLKNFLEYPHFI